MTRLSQAHSSGLAPTTGARLSALGWIALVCLLMVWRLHGQMEPLLSNDSFQYLSVADNATKGRYGFTSIVHFDAERSFGVLPAPEVTFPSGFPLAVAFVSKLGLSLPHAALLLNVATTLGCLALLSMAATALGLRRWVAQGLLGVFALNWLVALYGVAATSEALFSMLVLASVAALVMPPTHASKSAGWPRAVAAGVLLGLAYYVRYAAIFVLVGFVAAALISAWAGWREQRKHLLIASAVAAVFVVIGMLRNQRLVGNWRGGNEKSVHHPLISMLIDTVRTLDEVLLGVRTSSLMTLVHLVFFALLACAACLAFKAARGGSAADASRSVRLACVQLGVIVVVYFLCMFYAGMTTVISYGSRMFTPVLGPALMALACATELLASGTKGPARSRLRGIGMVMLVIYAGANLSSASPVWNDRTAWASKALLARDAQGRSAADAVRDSSTSRDVIIANYGQLVGHVLAVPTVSMVGTAYSSKIWDEKFLRDVTKQFKAGAVVISRPIPADAIVDDVYPSAFVLALANATHPAWLVPVFASSEVIVYRVQD